jgi:hypothetical protein
MKKQPPPPPEFKVLPPAAPNGEAVIYPQFYFTDEESERIFWEQVAAGWPDRPVGAR